MNLKRIIQYSDLYPEDATNLPDAKTLIKGLTRDNLCTITANMVQRLNDKPFFDKTLDPGKGKYDFIRFFFSDMSSELTQDLLNRYEVAKKRLPSMYDDGFYATSKAAIMFFQRLFFSVRPERNPNYSNQIEECFSKVLLLSNEAVYDFEFDSNKYSSESPDLQLARLYLAFNYANEDVETTDLHDLFRRQLTKSITLFSFLFRSKDKRIKILRSRFLAHFHIGNWVEYIIPHVMSIHFLKENSGLLVLKGSVRYGKKARRVIEKSCIEKDAIVFEENNPDFIVFRSKPFIMMKKHHYVITSPAFVLEHIFNSVYFELKQHSKAAGFINDDEFRHFYTTEFSQKYMFEGYVRKIMPRNTIFSISGSRCDEVLEVARKRGTNINGIVPPDYYIRIPEGCILFEYKDALSNAKVKESRNAEELFADIRKKFYENEKGSHKGVTQLLDNAKAIQKGGYFFDNPSPDSVVYPVLVVDNPVYSMNGMHTVLENMMREECSRREMRSDIIKPLVLLDVATLNLYAEYINSNGLVNTIESYYNHINPYAQKVLNEPFEALISFSEFMKDKDVGNMRHVFNRILHEVEPILRHYGKDA